MSQEIPLPVSNPDPQAPSPTSDKPLSTVAAPQASSIIQISHPRHKLQVIQIDDSDQDNHRTPQKNGSKEPKGSNEVGKGKKIAKIRVISKDPAKKSQKREKETHRETTKYKQTQLPRPTKKTDKTEKALQDKAASRRLQKEKKKQESQRRLGQFQQRYPYYFHQNRIRFPIEDKLLFIYREVFDYSETQKPKPINHPIVPPALLADLLQIQNFFSTFEEQLVDYSELPSKINKSLLYIALGSQGLDATFSQLLSCVLRLYLSDIFEKNKTDNIRMLNEHPFFTLLTYLHDNQELSQEIVVRIAQEIMRYLANVPSMRKSFEKLEYPSEYTLFSKLDLLLGLIRGLSQVDQFHTLVSIKSQKMQQLTKERTQLVAKLKIDQAQNLSNTQKLKDMTNAQKQMQQQQGIKAGRQLDRHKKKMTRLATQQAKSQQLIKQIKTKISDIGKLMPFLTSQVLFLGKDRNGSQYFFYVRESSRVYVKLRSYLLDNNQNFYIYQGKQTIVEVLKSLNSKGAKQRHLTDNLNFLLKQELINNSMEPEDSSNIMIEENAYRQITLEEVLAQIKETQQIFTVYLTLRNYQWAAPSVRQQFMAKLLSNTDLQILKEQLRNLQQNFLFGQQIQTGKQGYSQQQQARLQGKKKIPIRIWGINSQKTKKYWVEYLEECIDLNGIWLCGHIFKNSVEKYVKKKMEVFYEQQAREQKQRNLQEKRQRARAPRRDEGLQKNYRIASPSSQEQLDYSQQDQRQRRPNLRKRHHKKMNIQSEQQFEQEQVEQQESSSSSNDDFCGICGQYGDMICCDTCPRVYHPHCLKMKDIPEGDWSCFKCLEKMSKERQTRSRVKKIGRFL